MNSLHLRLDHRQGQALSPRLQHAVRLLQMSSQDFATLLRDTLGKNPFLEVGEDEPQEGEDEAAVEDDPAALHDGMTAGMNGESDSDADGDADRDVERDTDGDHAAADEMTSMDADDDGGGDRDLWHADAGTGQGLRPEDGELSAMEMMAAETSLTAHLHAQISLLSLPARDLALARMIVESLDDDGYLRADLPDLLSVAALRPPATLPELQIALRRVQSLEPAGVAARTVGECLLLQLPAIDCPDVRAMAHTIVTHHLPHLAARDVHGLAKQLQASPATVEQVCDRIRRLDPRPGWRLSTGRVAYVVPDVVVKRVRGQWNAQLNPAVVPKVRLNQVYERLFQRHRTADNAELGAHLQEARWTVRNLEQRFSTILDVARVIVKRQRNFFEYGSMAMKPLGLREVADEVGIHESTVSRVTNNKYMATPLGVFELKYFFSRAMVSANGSACSGTAIRSLVKDIIASESSGEPLSDAEITRQLAQQGLVVARRTVTKYRQMLKIEAVDRRRRHV
ncbi:MAG: RNA polymerase factor sigma-54 [Chitinophagaceae bacterium]|nr:RNA polymerase factor sigma-54 [Rubrivivax sp.]